MCLKPLFEHKEVHKKYLQGIVSLLSGCGWREENCTNPESNQQTHPGHSCKQNNLATTPCTLTIPLPFNNIWQPAATTYSGAPQTASSPRHVTICNNLMKAFYYIFFDDLFWIFYDFFTPSRGRVPRSTHRLPFLGRLGTGSTYVTPIFDVFGPPTRPRIGRNRYPTLTGIFGGPAHDWCPHHITWPFTLCAT